MIRTLTIFSLVFFCYNLTAQISRAQLEKERLEIIKKIESSQNRLAQAKASKSSLLSEINALEEQIDARESLVSNLQEESALVEKELTTDTIKMIVASTETKDNLEDYYELLRMQYRNKLLSQTSAAIWSSEKVLEALTKYRIFKTYERYVLAKGEKIQGLVEQTDQIKEDINENKTEQAFLLADEKENLAELKDKKAALILKAKSLTGKEKRIQEELNRQRTDREKFNKEIDLTIRGASSIASNTSTMSTTVVSTSIDKNSIEAKRGFLSWPMSNPSVIKRYGPQAHPTIPDIMVTNNGIDLTSSSPNVVAIFPGKVISIAAISDKGPTIIVQHDNDYYSVYSNLLSSSVTKGSDLNLGQTIGTAQSTSSGKAQLHFEIWQGQKTLNPKHWLKNN